MKKILFVGVVAGVAIYSFYRSLSGKMRKSLPEHSGELMEANVI